MKHYLLNLLLLIVFTSLTALAQTDTEKKDIQTQEQTQTSKLVKASCGSCNFDMKGACSLVIKMDGKVIPVEGYDIHSLDAHGKHGLCNTIRVAEIDGELNEEGVFVASSFELMPVGTKIPAKVKDAKKGCSAACKKACCSGKTKAKKKGCSPECKKVCCA